MKPPRTWQGGAGSCSILYKSRWDGKERKLGEEFHAIMDGGRIKNSGRSHGSLGWRSHLYI